VNPPTLTRGIYYSEKEKVYRNITDQRAHVCMNDYMPTGGNSTKGIN
jgi:hypothetical protein